MSHEVRWCEGSLIRTTIQCTPDMQPLLRVVGHKFKVGVEVLIEAQTSHCASRAGALDPTDLLSMYTQLLMEEPV
eukprot:2242971-Amphidinium_carterae.3